MNKELNKAEALMRADAAHAWLNLALNGREDLSIAIERAVNLMVEARGWLDGDYKSAMEDDEKGG